jgi:hypothetical protein
VPGLPGPGARSLKAGQTEKVEGPRDPEHHAPRARGMGSPTASRTKAAPELEELQHLADRSTATSHLAEVQRKASASFMPLQRVIQRRYERLTVLEPAQKNIVQFPNPSQRTIVIEVMVPTKQSLSTAKALIDKVAVVANGHFNLAIAIGANREAPGDHGSGTERGAAIDDAGVIAAYANERGVACAVVPMLWRRPDKDSGGYIFPFIEARAALGRHEYTAELGGLGAGEVFHRLMDADVTDDPLFDYRPMEDEEKSKGEVKVHDRKEDADEPRYRRREATMRDDARDGQKRLNSALSSASKKGEILTGGYNWDTSGLDASPVLRDLIKAMNDIEHAIRETLIAKGLERAVYAPEPNTYIPAGYKGLWDEGQISSLGSKDDYDRQMGESAKGRQATSSFAELAHRSSIAVTKPRKDWLNNYQPLASALAGGDLEAAEAAFDKLMTAAHQSYLNPDVALKTAKAQATDLQEWERKVLDEIICKARAVLWSDLKRHLLARSQKEEV